MEKRLMQILVEDIGQGDITTAIIVPKQLVAEAELITKEDGVAAGIEEITILAETLGLTVTNLVDDGEKIENNQVILKIRGDARTILTAERTILNILSRMSGIATLTNRLVEKLGKHKLNLKIAATRKTAPGLLYFDKKAVLLGGGDPHRLHLDDMIMIKDNHIRVVGSIQKAVRRARERAPFSKKIEVEVTSAGEALKAAEAGADIIMLDNFTLKQIKETVKELKNKGFYGKIPLEASGGIKAEKILDYATTQVDFLSLGELTHSTKALNMSLEVKKTWKTKK
ncbi:carboxylating nicotinate-nucleotide diphosphorylase [Candidatus Bathyarchaeota archaeon]|nr:carboxylating nicotinate-nucleotide diphosphorylase [Candidatus Bathyarchaeota archaeon]